MMPSLLPTFLAVAMLVAPTVLRAHDDEHAHGGRHARPSGKAIQKSFGRAGDEKRVTRTVRLRMTDRMRFMPDHISVREGETVRFVVENTGSMLHEIVIGGSEDLKDHAAMMRQYPNMRHDEPYMAHVAPGKSQSLVWQFNRPGEFGFACLVAGHFEAGMVGRISVEGAPQGKDKK